MNAKVTGQLKPTWSLICTVWWDRVLLDVYEAVIICGGTDPVCSRYV